MPNQDQVLSALRWLLTVAGGYAAQRGYLDNEQVLSITGAVLALATVAWGLFAHSKQQKLASVAAMPNVATIVTTDQKTADAAPSEKVVSAVDQATKPVRMATF